MCFINIIIARDRLLKKLMNIYFRKLCITKSRPKLCRNALLALTSKTITRLPNNQSLFVENILQPVQHYTNAIHYKSAIVLKR